ncbi:MAG: hemerythrin domain-containing protein [Actinomycetota bacterium]|nr:MAG: hemerythrin domain-containing protein [Actinomycetota bacterium]
MCSYCGCEAEKVMKALTDEHETIASLARHLISDLDQGNFESAALQTSELAVLFDRHGASEENGLFRQLLLAGEAVEEVEKLLADHIKFRNGFGDPAAVSQPDQLRKLLKELFEHAELEETDLFPYAWQVLPGESWDLIEAANLRTF